MLNIVECPFIFRKDTTSRAFIIVFAPCWIAVMIRSGLRRLVAYSRVQNYFSPTYHRKRISYNNLINNFSNSEPLPVLIYSPVPVFTQEMQSVQKLHIFGFSRD